MFVSVKNVSKSYNKDGGFLIKSKKKILEDINLQINKSECVGLIGESGSGKSTLSRIILGLEKPEQGTVEIEGESISKWIKQNKGNMSVVFQDYTTSVNPQFTVGNIIGEPLIAVGEYKDVDNRIHVLLTKVGLPHSTFHKYPHELSGGQLQRVCIARAIATEPKFIVLDEAISSLDVSVQAQILQLLHELKDDMDMTFLFVAHDLQAVANLCDRILFLYKGKIVEELPSAELVHAQHPYAKKLLTSVMPLNIHKN
ncbi:ABC transporter ATP-binding protein [Bacillus sp. SD075]|uniref:ABC transporter ATP-binding protein n=1 Tax=Bacillus sp. SD075 TaxID=2781732 RepID=UPI001A965AEE|nr:ABC transporter ATP-binding protein [Bacillus sp. SD075]MBO0997511.1 ABC transporter ATP-binding protein [Bacillus sp. SD075]